MKRIAILGSTGSIGQNTLDVVRHLPGRFQVVGLTTNSNIKLLEQQIREFHPSIACIADEKVPLSSVSSHATEIVRGLDGLVKIATHKQVDLLVVAIAGSDALIPLLEAIGGGKEIALANKESLVIAGSLVMERARQRGIQIIPIDSEHNAIFQCLQGKTRRDIARIYLTGSGGPLRNVPKQQFSTISPEAAVNHPKWRMGKKISVDSATLMNKGLEIIEAKWLFDIDIEAIEVLIHPEAIIHSMVEFIDGTILALLGVTDMRLAIQYALTYPERLPANLPMLNFAKLGALTFHRPDRDRFPCLCIARKAAQLGGTLPAVLNSADQECVEAYLARNIKLTDIPEIIDKILSLHKKVDNPSLDDILEAVKWAKQETTKQINCIKGIK